LTSYTWDARQRLGGTSGASSSAFAYDATGRRVGTTINGASTSYLYDGANSVSTTQSGQSVQLVSGTAMDEWFARVDAGGTKAFLRDALGSTVALTDSAGAVTDVYTYEPFGRSIAQGSTANAERFTGREQDNSESYYYRARYYRPTEGRFLSEDAIRLAPDASLYAYVGGDPVSRIDPTGRLQGPVTMPGVGTGVGATLGVGALAAFDIWIIQHDIDLLQQLCEAYGWCTPSSPNRECAAKQWRCTVRCAVIDLRTGSAVRYIETEGVGATAADAFKDGQKRLQNSTPPGFRAKHCHTVGRCEQK
jgi:RHS repeat-associated protein